MSPDHAGALLTLADDVVSMRPLTALEREVVAADRSTLSVLRFFLLAVVLVVGAAAARPSRSSAALWAATGVVAAVLVLAQCKMASHAAGIVAALAARAPGHTVTAAAARTLATYDDNPAAILGSRP